MYDLLREGVQEHWRLGNQSCDYAQLAGWTGRILYGPEDAHG